MKNLITITLLSLTLFFACQQKKTEEEQKINEKISSTFDTTALKTTPFDASEDQSFFLRYKFVSGESFRYRMTTISQNEQSITTDTSRADHLSQTIIFVMDFNTLSLDTDSVAELQCMISSVNLKANANGIDITYQSGSAKDSTEKVKFAEYEAFVNNPFNIRVGKQGEIIDIYMIDKIINRLLDLRGLADSLSSQEKIMAKQDLTNKSIKPLLSQIFREVPDHKMATDSAWSYKRESMPVVVFQIDYENVYTVEKLEMLSNEKLAVINGMVKTKVSGSQTYSEKGINYKFEKPISTAGGKIYFNLNKGMIQKSRTQTRMENAYKMEMPTPEGLKKASAKEVTSNINVIELL